MYAIGSNSANRARRAHCPLSGGKHAARKLKRAQILLAADLGASDDDIATNVGVGGSTVYRTKQRFVLGNLEAALSEEPRPGQAGSSPAKRKPCWLQRPVPSPRRAAPLDPGAVGGCTGQGSPSTTMSRARPCAAGWPKTTLKPWRKDMWCIPQVDGEYVARMENVLDSMPKSPIRSAR